MTTPTPPMFGQAELQHFRRMKSRGQKRSRINEIIHSVRQGNMRDLFPEELNFSISFDGSPIANFIDIVAHDMAEGIAPLPSLACVSGAMASDADFKRAERKNKIGLNYWEHSKLSIQMLSGADRYVSYGFVPLLIEPDVKNKMPYVHVLGSIGSYYELDRYGNVSKFGNSWRNSIDELCAKFPECQSVLRTDPKTGKMVAQGDTELEVVRYVDDTYVTLLCPERDGVILGRYAHKMSRPPVVIAERPGESDTPRGQFDDVIWVQVARAIYSALALEAAFLAVQAPIAVPDDMDELPVGPHALMQSEKANEIHRVSLELPPTIFAESQALDQELKTGARYPDARTGGVQGASVITGKGVEALLGTFDAQIKGAQIIFKQALQDVTSMCFEMDQAWWPDDQKTVTGTFAGESYEFKYAPAKDINERYSCTVTYGFAAGMQPSQSIITLLQLEGAGLIARSTTQENMPFSIDHVQEQRKIDVEGWREALKQGLFAYVQASGQIATQGGDPSDLFTLAVEVIHRLQDGQTVEDAVAAAYAQEQAKKQAEAQAAAQAAAAQQSAQGGPPGAAPPGSPGAPPINGDNGLPPGVAPGQAGQPPGGMPTIERMVAGFRGDGSLPVDQSTIERRVPTGT